MAKQRLRADPEVTTSQLQEVLSAWMKKRNRRNILSMLQALRDIKPKGAVSAEPLAGVSDLFIELFSICPNTIIPDVKLRQALSNEHASDKIVFGDPGDAVLANLDSTFSMVS
eukprot:9082207-Karenia_brevis.AAC.1